MKKYAVKVPIAGYVYKEVEANSEEEAMDIALNDGWCYDELDEMEMYDKINEGNVGYLRYDEIEAEELKE